MNTTYVLHQPSEVEQTGPAFLCFVDLTETFDEVRLSGVIEISIKKLN